MQAREGKQGPGFKEKATLSPVTSQSTSPYAPPDRA